MEFCQSEKVGTLKWILIVTKHFNVAVNDFDAKKSAQCSWVLLVTGLVVSGTQCNERFNSEE